jgi:hypothetical protein
MATVIKQGVKMDVEVMEEEEDPVVVVQVEVAEEETEEDKVMAAELVANTPSKLQLRLPFLRHNIIKKRILILSSIISIKLVTIPLGLGTPTIKRQQVNKPLLK